MILVLLGVENLSLIFSNSEVISLYSSFLELIKRIKPDASRSTSKECYILGIKKK